MPQTPSEVSNNVVDSYPSPREVWAVLSAINVNAYTEKKLKLTYLSWAWAWQVMKETYPEFEVIWHDDILYADGSITVACSVSIGPHVKEYMWLPVMDNKMNAQESPSARHISDAKMRCLVKCFAVLGLGLYIYAGEDLPSEPEHIIEHNLVREITQLSNTLDGRGYEFSEDLKTQVREAIDQFTFEGLAGVKTTLEDIVLTFNMG